MYGQDLVISQFTVHLHNLCKRNKTLNLEYTHTLAFNKVGEMYEMCIFVDGKLLFQEFSYVSKHVRRRGFRTGVVFVCVGQYQCSSSIWQYDKIRGKNMGYMSDPNLSKSDKKQLMVRHSQRRQCRLLAILFDPVHVSLRRNKWSYYTHSYTHESVHRDIHQAGKEDP